MSSQTRTRRHITDVLFTLTLFAVFAAASLIVVFIGAEVYTATIERSDTSFELNSTLSFVATKIRQHDSVGAVRIDYVEGVAALVMQQVIGESVFETWVYHHEGTLREIFTREGNTSAVWLGAGQALVQVASFGFHMPKEGLVEITATSTNGTFARSLVSLNSGRFF